jgi:hypothetical protein
MFAFMILLAVIVVVGLWAMGIYNGLVTARNRLMCSCNVAST